MSVKTHFLIKSWADYQNRLSDELNKIGFVHTLTTKVDSDRFITKIEADLSWEDVGLLSTHFDVLIQMPHGTPWPSQPTIYLDIQGKKFSVR
jgi:hypothetical protein